MKVVINSVASKMGGAATYLRHLARYLRTVANQADYTLIVPENAQRECAELAGERVTVRTSRWANRGPICHLLWEQVWLRWFLLVTRADLLINTSAYGLLFCPCPQTIILRNPVAFSRRYLRHLRQSGYAHRVPEVILRRELMRISALFSEKVFVPTDGMGRSVLEWIPQTRAKLRTARYGVELLPAPPGEKAWMRQLEERAPKGAVRLLYVSHYAKHKNFDTLIAAIPAIQERLGRPVRVVLTVRVGAGVEWCNWDTSATARAMRRLGVEDAVIALGTVPHEEIAELYRRCDLFVFPSYLESFGQPLAEAMASGLPVVASDEPVCRELCGDAAVYFKTLDPDDLARAVAGAMGDPALLSALRARGPRRAREFSWPGYFHKLLAEAQSAVSRQSRRPSPKGPSGVSAFLITLNEEANIRKCLQSLVWADEVFVVDSFSTDATVAICREFPNVKVFQRPFLNYASQRNWGLDHLPFRTPWIFVLDADEVVPPSLAAEILSKARNDTGRYMGYLGEDRHIFLGGHVRNATRCIVRLFRRGQGRYVRPVNEKLEIVGALGRFSNQVAHDTRKDLADWVAKNNRYSTMEAVEYFRARRKRPRPTLNRVHEVAIRIGSVAGDIGAAMEKVAASAPGPSSRGMGSLLVALVRPDLRRIALKKIFVRAPLRPVLKFLYMYLWRGGALDGARGLIYSLLAGWVEFQISCKVFESELRQEGRLREP